ncbi:hypothetical protein AAE250_06545 [Bacteroides sp. GD17]|jgi:hypothetical protein|uniref:hypothetical protein n=1 Tax=Bacteroides sp. GD17 TaxID=3139826 RepID=UPI0025D91B58|nr:hypothetical protein [uncultured Bacteroides sp.]
MDDKKLNEKESLELIAQMIQNTKSGMAENAGVPFLIWGYTTVLTSLVVWFLLKSTGNYNWQWCWFLLPTIAYTVMMWTGRNRQKMMKTYIDRILGYVWLVFGAGGFFVSWVAIFFWNLSVLFVILLMMGMGTALTGLIVKMRVVTICGILGGLLSLGCLCIHGFDQILLFALAFVFMMVIPGHYLNRIEKTVACLKN